MKFISALFFIALLILSWNLVHRPPALSFETHAGIQERLAGWLEENYKKQFPELQNFRILQIRTRTINADQVEAQIRTEYELPDETGTPSRHQNELRLKLERVVDQERSLLERWKVSAIKTLKEAIEFSDGMIVTPRDRSRDEGESEADLSSPNQ
jgi:hypothetical protein